MNKQTAWVLTDGLFQTYSAKTAHGLVRGSEKFEIVGLIDHDQTKGKDAGVLLDGKPRNIPIFANVVEALEVSRNKPHYAIIGIANPGGKMPPTLKPLILELIQHRISIINGLHEFLKDDENLVEAALKHNIELIDVRHPKSKKELHFWTGKIYEVACPIIAVIGMDTHLGKRTTCRFLQKSCQEKGIKAEMIFTGQTGWMQSGKYGFIFDSTINDFVSGELEHAIHSCYINEQPQIIFMEGQSGLRNPSGPCGAELLVSGNAKHSILVYNPKQKYFDNKPDWGNLPTLEDEIKLIAMYGSKVMGVALNTSTCNYEEAKTFQHNIATSLHIPVVLPIEEGVGELVDALQKLLK